MANGSSTASYSYSRSWQIYILLSSIFVVLILSCSLYISLVYLIPSYKKVTSVSSTCQNKVLPFMDSAPDSDYYRRYQQGVQYLKDENYVQAKAVFDMLRSHGYGNSGEMYKETIYLWALSCAENRHYRKAINLFISIYDYKDAQLQRRICNYLLGKSDMDRYDFGSARENFIKAGDYEDAEELAFICTYKHGLRSYSLGDYGTAIEMLEQTLDYEKSYEYYLKAKYEYVNKYFKSGDFAAYSYLNELIELGYLDSRTDFLDKLGYKWGLKIYANRTKGNYITDLDAIPANYAWYFNIKVEKGLPGDTIKLYYAGVYPDGNVIGDYMDCDFEIGDSTWVSFTYSDASTAVFGTFRLYIFTEDNVLVAYKEIEIASP